MSPSGKGVDLTKHFIHTLPSLLTFLVWLILLLTLLSPRAISDLNLIHFSHSSNTGGSTSASSQLQSDLGARGFSIPGRLMNSEMRARSMLDDDSDSKLNSRSSSSSSATKPKSTSDSTNSNSNLQASNNQITAAVSQVNAFFALGPLGSCFVLPTAQNNNPKLKCSSTSMVPYFISLYDDFNLPFQSTTLGLPLTFPLFPFLLMISIILTFFSFVFFLLSSIPHHINPKPQAEGIPAQFLTRLLNSTRSLLHLALLNLSLALFIGLVITISMRIQLGDVVSNFRDLRGVLDENVSVLVDQADFGSAFGWLWAAWSLMAVSGLMGIWRVIRNKEEIQP